SCRRTEGRPGERSFAPPARSERLLRVVIATPFGAVLRRPVELKQYLSIRYTERLAEAGIEPSVGSTGDSYDNALAESVIGLYKTEEIRRRGPWRSVEDVEFATLEWVAGYNTRRLLEPLGYVSPDEFERAYYNRQTASAELAVLTSPSLRKTGCGSLGLGDVSDGCTPLPQLVPRSEQQFVMDPHVVLNGFEHIVGRSVELAHR